MKNYAKVIVVGVDGGTLNLMEPWMDAGKLPTFAKIRDKGVHGKLRSTIPCYSAPAWVSIVTGCLPGKHGIYDFFRTDTFTKKIVSSRNRKVLAIWNILTELGMKSTVVNVPGTYPPEKINGVMITGLLTPSPDSDFTFPKDIKEKLVEGKLGKYMLEQVAVDDIPKYLTARYAPEKLAKQVISLTRSHAEVTMNLMKKYEPDFTMVVFRGTDDVQHLLWRNKELILSCYQQADKYIGRMMDFYPDAVFIIVSDHGFSKPRKYLYVNNLLYNTGYLKTSSNFSYNFNALSMMMFDKLSRLIFHLVPIDKLAHSFIGRKLILLSWPGSSIDFSQTKAFYHSVCSRGIRINLKDKYKQGIVCRDDYEKLRDELITLFKNIRDPETKETVIKNIYKWEDIYGENAVNDPLDLILEFEQDYSAQELLKPSKEKQIDDSNKKSMTILTPPSFYDWIGDHHKNGILFMYGKNIKSNYRIDASVVDIVPTILAAMGNPIPKNVDGKVIEEAFIERPKIIKSDVYKDKKKLFTNAEIEKIKKIRKNK